MPQIHTVATPASACRTAKFPDILNPEEEEVWFDAIDQVEMEATWFNASDTHYAEPDSAGKTADSLVPFTEDCRRGVQQFIRILGEYEESKMLSACLQKILPGTPISLITAASSLYSAITEQRNIDTAALYALGMASWCLPEDINVFSQLAAFIRDTVAGWTEETFLHQFLGGEENPASGCLFTALALTAIVAGRRMKDEGAPQRGPLKVPAFVANIFIRGSHYWYALENIVRNGLPSTAETQRNPEFLRRVPAFEVDTCVEMTGDVCDDYISCFPLKPRITAFLSNSTVVTEAFTKATVRNRPAPVPEINYYPAEKAHFLTVEKLSQKSGLYDLLNCATRVTKTRQQVKGKVITNTHFKTECDATAYSTPQQEEIKKEPGHTATPETSASSLASGRSGGDVLLPLVATSVVPVATSYMQAVKSKVFITAGSVAGMTGLVVGGKLLWNKFTSLISAEGDMTNQALHKGKKTKLSYFIKEANNKIINMFRGKGLPDKGNVDREKMFYIVSVYLFIGKDDVTRHENKLRILARKILSADGLYGGKDKEPLSTAQAELVIRTWLFKNILTMAPDEYIISKMKADKIPGGYTVSSIHEQLSFENLFKDGRLYSDKLEPFQKAIFHTMWSNFLMAEMPFLSYKEDSVKKIKLSSYDFAHLYSGSRFLKTSLVKDFTAREAMAVGETMWDLAEREGVTEDKLAYYKAPALFFIGSVSSRKKNQDNGNYFDSISTYIHHRKEVSEVQKDIENKYNNYLSATKTWLSKGKLADVIVSKCPKNSLSPGLINQADAILTPKQKKEKAEKFAKQRYLNGLSKPCNTAPDSLDDEYKKMTAAVADSFRKIDRYLILSAVSIIPEDEQEFIFSPDTIIYPAKFTMKTNRGTWSAYGVPYNNDINVSLSKTDLFSVHLGKQERIYALKGVTSDEEGYRLIRVDRDIRKYINGGILDYVFDDKYKVVDSVVDSAGDTFSYSIYADKQKISDENDNINSLVESLSGRHRDEFYRKLYESGNDKSDIQKLWVVIKHIIPFYDCIEGILNNDVVQAVPACLMDALAFIPVFGQAASLSGKFGIGIARGLRSGASIAGRQGIKAAGKNVLREVRMPTTAELASIGKGAFRAVDPGFELAAGISRKFGDKIVNLLSSDKKKTDLAKNIISAGGEDQLLQTSSVKPVMATLPYTNVQTPVTAVGKMGRRNIYVRVNMETGENFGKKFLLGINGELIEIIGGVKVGKSILPELKGDIEEFWRYIKELKAGSCVAFAARSKRQVNCSPLSLSTQALDRILEYATIEELSVLARNQELRDSVFKAVNNAAKEHPETADRLIESIASYAKKNGDTNLIATIQIGRVDTDIYRAMKRYQQQPGIQMKIESPRVLGSHEFEGYNPDPEAPSQPVHVSYTAIDEDNFVPRLNIVVHGMPGRVLIDNNAWVNADELHQILIENGIFDDEFSEIRMLVCHSADETPDGGISVAERLSQLTRKPVEGFHGPMTMYEAYEVGDITIPSINMVNDAYIQGGKVGATEFMHNNREYIIIGVHPDPDPEIPNIPETFYPI